jgi:hypothetical protein
MRIRLDSPALVDDLMRALTQRSDVVVDRVGDCELEVALIGSFHDGGEAILEREIDAWLEDRGRGSSGLRLVR